MDPSKKTDIGAVERGLMVFLISLKACPTILTELVIQIKIYTAASVTARQALPLYTFNLFVVVLYIKAPATGAAICPL